MTGLIVKDFKIVHCGILFPKDQLFAHLTFRGVELASWWEFHQRVEVMWDLRVLNDDVLFNRILDVSQNARVSLLSMCLDFLGVTKDPMTCATFVIKCLDIDTYERIVTSYQLLTSAAICDIIE